MTILYSASELGGCSKYLIAKRLGYEALPSYGDDIPAFARGHAVEQEVLIWLQSPSQGWTITQTQAEFYLPMPDNAEGEKVAVICHPDALGSPLGGSPHAIEIKSCNDDAYRAIKEKGWDYAGHLWPRYLWQLSCYHHATNLPVQLVARNIEPDRDGNYGTYMEVLDSSPPLYTLDQIRERVRKLEEAAVEYNIPLDCDFPNNLCPLAYLHEVEMVDDPELEKLAIMYDEVRSEKKSLLKVSTNKRLDLRYKLLSALGVDETAESQPGSKSIDTGLVKVTASYGPTSFPFVDYDKLREKGIDPKEVLKPAKYGYRLNVTVRRGKKREND